MTHDHIKGRGVLDRSATLLKVPLAKSMSYNEALDQAVKCVYGEQSLDTTYYLADTQIKILRYIDRKILSIWMHQYDMKNYVIMTMFMS